LGRVISGWLLDLYAGHSDGLNVWLIEDDLEDEENTPSPKRVCLRQSFPITFYAAGPDARLRQLWRYLESQPIPVELGREQRRDLFQPQPVAVLAVHLTNPIHQPRLFARLSAAFPDLNYYNADITLPLRHAARYNTFPLARVQVSIDQEGTIQTIEALDSAWDIDPQLPLLRIMRLQPDVDPHHAPPRWIHVQAGSKRYRFSLKHPRPLLINLAAVLRRHDPDLLLTGWGDTWLLPHLLELSQKLGLPLPLNRDPGRGVAQQPERSYHAYGQVIHRGRQMLLFGRWHLDMYNAMLYHDYDLHGVLESARVSATPVQKAARLSPGSGISAMQVVTALRHDVLVPWRKQQAETLKSALELIRADQGGLVYQPLTGLHRDVAEIDFISMYPSIMANFNISPETTGKTLPNAQRVPELDQWITQDEPGLIPLTLKPLVDKRIKLKGRLADISKNDPRRRVYKARATAHKWLLVTCFGYLGYKNARFGRIEAHQAVTAYGRECLLRAKEAAEEAGFTVLHMYVDGLWVQRPGCNDPRDVDSLLKEINERTGLSIALEGIYRWVAFLPSRVNPRWAVPNRYFGVFQDGSIKKRGIAARRRDAPPFVAESQLAILELLARAEDAGQLPGLLPEILHFLRAQLNKLRRGRVPVEELLVTQKLSRELEEYRVPSPAARAAIQLAAIGKRLRPGQHIRFLYILGKTGVHAWDLPTPPNPAALDLNRYQTLLIRAASEILQPIGVSEATLETWLLSNAAYGAPPGFLPPPRAEISPLFHSLPAHKRPDRFSTYASVNFPGTGSPGSDRSPLPHHG